MIKTIKLNSIKTFKVTAMKASTLHIYTLSKTNYAIKIIEIETQTNFVINFYTTTGTLKCI